MNDILTQTDIAALTILACPACRGRLFPVEPGRVRCGSCLREYPYQKGIWRFLLPEQQIYYRPFLDQYRPARRGEGWEHAEDDYYLALPDVATNDRHAALWRLRRRSYNYLMQEAGPGKGQYALDLGAGCGWLSRRLAEADWQPVALDLHCEGRDSLEGSAIYLQKAGVNFVRGQASMDTLPLSHDTIALCVSNGAFHYAALELTLPEIYRVLKPGGRFIICDSPVYTQPAAGQAMVSELAEHLESITGLKARWPGGQGFLLLDETIAHLNKIGFSVNVQWLERPWSSSKRFVQHLLHPKARQQARFPVFIACKPVK